ncbi:MAG: prepilin peptidase [Desulfitobacteriaceae bacterium]
MYLALIFGLIGLLIGSFLNVVIYRVPRGESIVSPGSHCPACGHFLRPWELVPIVSFLFLRGSCQKCRAPISWRYPAVELLTGVLFFYTTLRGGDPSLRLLFDLAFVSFLITLSLIDIDTFRLPDVLVLPLWALGIVRILVPPGPSDWYSSIMGSVIAGGVFWLIVKLYPKGMGFGDVKFVAALGAYLGFPLIFLAVFLAGFSGSLFGGMMILLGRKGFKQQIPFGPYLAFGSLITFYWGRQFLEAYLNWALH